MEQTLTLIDAHPEIREESVAPQPLATLFDAHHLRLYRLARRMSGDPEEARDLVQQTFLRAAQRPGSLPPGAAAAEGWLVRTLVNLCLDRRRRQRVRLRSAARIESQVAPFADPEGAAVARATVGAALAQLSPRRRAVIVLHELEDRNVAEIASLLGLARVTVRWHLAAARRDLRTLLTNPEIRT